jgi:competence protein ComEC
VVAGLWLALWQGKIRRWAILPLALGAAGAAAAPVPDLLVTGDGEHLAIVRADGVPVLLRTRSGEFVRSLMSEASAFDGDPAALDAVCDAGGIIARPIFSFPGGRRFHFIDPGGNELAVWSTEGAD